MVLNPDALPRTHTNPQADFLKPQPPQESKFRSFLNPHQLYPKPCFNVAANFRADPSRCSRAWIPKRGTKPRAQSCKLRVSKGPSAWLWLYSGRIQRPPSVPHPTLSSSSPPQLHHPHSTAHPFSIFPTHPEHQESRCPSEGRANLSWTQTPLPRSICFPKRLPRSLNFDPPAFWLLRCL